MICNVTTTLLVWNKGLCRQGNTNPRAGSCLGAEVKSLTAKTQNGERKKKKKKKKMYIFMIPFWLTICCIFTNKTNKIKKRLNLE